MIDFARREVLGQREDVRVHQAAGGLLFVLEQLGDAAAGFRPDQLEHRARQLFGQVIDQGRRVVGRNLLEQARDLLGRSQREQFGAFLRTDLAQRLHRELAVLLDEDVERGVPFAVRQLGENLREVGGMLLLKKVQQVRRRPHAQQTTNGFEDEIDSALCCHDNPRRPIFVAWDYRCRDLPSSEPQLVQHAARRRASLRGP